MHKVVAGLEIPYVAMQNSENLSYDDVCTDVARELCECVGEAELSGLPAWRMIVDPGIGFSKNTEQNLDIINGLKDMRGEIGKRRLALSRVPLLVGVSRKRFLGEICGQPNRHNGMLPLWLVWRLGFLGVRILCEGL
ncbi:dihydropteroate synthase [Striga asiatica]|uniref:Dihydropteroate synthase n=1 Tax=Striga asiatica TaxID=4170 RepID=A0A5A7PGR4_STRAF|nr:dihydropteroate synthase [Striga asiatica]